MEPGDEAGELQLPTDTIKTSDGDLKISFIGHGSLMFRFKGMVIHADPFSRLADYGKLPKADLVLVTHHHGDHMDPKALKMIGTDKTQVLLTKLASEKAEGKIGDIIKPGETKVVKGLKVETLPAYNLVHKQENGEFFHVKGDCNSYVVTFGDKRIFIGGDTENTPEMKALENIDVAFLPMNLPFTMTEEMVADAAAGFKPAILYVYHFRPEKADFEKLKGLMKDLEKVELRYHMPGKKK
ncbi:MAG: MBL fold metallo-hydrolase [bacterium]|nr:MBL fold metallo-hydrolase [bacterium]